MELKREKNLTLWKKGSKRKKKTQLNPILYSFPRGRKTKARVMEEKHKIPRIAKKQDTFGK